MIKKSKLAKKLLKQPLSLSVGFHVLILMALLLAVTFDSDQSPSSPKMMQATIIPNVQKRSNQQIQHQKQIKKAHEEYLKKLAQKKQKQLLQKRKHLEKLKREQQLKAKKIREKKLAEKRAKIQQEKLAEKRRKIQEEALAKKQQKIRQEKLEKKRQQEALLKKKQKEQKEKALKLKEKLKKEKLEKEKIARQVAQEKSLEQQLDNLAKTTIVVNKYKTLILNAISQHWIIPGNANKNLSAQLLIHLAPGGVVLNVSISKTSGDPLLDRSAITAVWKASPLPTPSDPTVFSQFRSFHLTVKPETVV